MGAAEVLVPGAAPESAVAQTVLVVDDHPQAQVLLTRFLKRMGYRVETAANGLEAVNAVTIVHPDIILMDLTMPVMGGYEATEQIRAAANDRWIPIVFLSATPDSAALIRALERGADDYLVKPISYTVLRAKMRAVSRMLGMQRQLEDRNARLAAYRASEDEQNRMAQHVISRLANHHLFDDSVLQHWTAPASFFSGDLVIAGYTPAGVLHVMLADGAGHGLAAALSALPVTQPFYRMTEKGYSLSSIVAEMNGKIRQLLPVERFVAATLIAVDFKEQVVEIWNGGNPPLCIMAGDGRVLHAGCSLHPPLGVAPDHLFSSDVDVYRYDEACQLVACSDGLYEGAGWRANVTGAQDLANLLSSHPAPERLEALKAHFGSTSTGHFTDDDATAVLITCDPGEHQVPERGVATAVPPSPGDWRFEVRLSPEQLRHVDVVPLVHDLASDMLCGGARNAKLYLVLTELISNAVDHGLLGLDSAMKREADGFQRYLSLRSERLAALSAGAVEIRIVAIEVDGRSLIRMQVTDTGSGFDYGKVLEYTPQVSSPYGRGIPLVKRLCESVEYRGRGNEVEVVFPMAEPNASTAAPPPGLNPA
jgi:CheY-like chemotaxis protein/anti-sigma regulatory factor (Ser/Thr protein kinase)